MTVKLLGKEIRKDDVVEVTFENGTTKKGTVFNIDEKDNTFSVYDNGWYTSDGSGWNDILNATVRWPEENIDKGTVVEVQDEIDAEWFAGLEFIAKYKDKNVCYSPKSGSLEFWDSVRIPKFEPVKGSTIKVSSDNNRWYGREFITMDGNLFVCRSIVSDEEYFGWKYGKAKC